MPPEFGPTPSDGAIQTPVGFVSGAVDLVYRDPSDDSAWVVADYKTDRVDAAGLMERAAGYAGQGDLYVRGGGRRARVVGVAAFRALVPERGRDRGSGPARSAGFVSRITH